jgi:hypothetical protein
MDGERSVSVSVIGMVVVVRAKKKRKAKRMHREDRYRDTVKDERASNWAIDTCIAQTGGGRTRRQNRKNNYYYSYF